MFYHSTLRGPGILSMEIGKDAWALKHFLVMQVATLTTGGHIASQGGTTACVQGSHIKHTHSVAFLFFYSRKLPSGTDVITHCACGTLAD